MASEIWLRCGARERKGQELVCDACHKNNRKTRGARGKTAAQIIFFLTWQTIYSDGSYVVTDFNRKWLMKPIRSFFTHSGIPGTNHVALNILYALSWSAGFGQHSLMIITSLLWQGSSLEHMEDRSSILSKFDDVEKLLKEIEDNTHPDRGNRSNFRHNRQEKVDLEWAR